METISHLVLTFLMNALWQVLLILGIAGASARMVGDVLSARHQHLLWVTALMLSVVLPFWSLLDTHESSSMSSLGELFGNMSGSGISLSASSQEDADWIRALFRRRHHPVLVPLPITSALVAGYLMFLFYRFVKLWRAWWRTKAIRRLAYGRVVPSVVEAVATRCQAALHLKEVKMLCSSQIASPIVVGVHCPVIILPESLFQETSTEVLASALGHEMTHIRRHDFLLNLAYELLYLPISFHPAAAVMRRRIQQTREVACDEMVAECIVEPTCYARSLVYLAGLVSTLDRSSYTLGIFDAHILEERVMKLLNKNHRTSSPFMALVVCLIALCLGITTIVAATLSLQTGRPKPRSGNVSTRDIVGRWEGMMMIKGKNLPAGRITIKDDGGKLSGTTVEYWYNPDHPGGTPTLSPEEPFIDPKFDGKKLSFKLVIDYTGTGKKEDVFMEMTLTAPDEAELSDLGTKLVDRVKFARQKK
jgi:beta-lactamase regulating signal transducer with metallopeptidase domain